MNDRVGASVFLEQRSYRQRRLRDVARMLPVVAILLWLLPLLWPGEGAEATNLSTVSLYVFGTWIILIICAAMLSHRLGASQPRKPDSTD